LQSDGVWLQGQDCTPEGVAAAAARILDAEPRQSHADAGAHFVSLLDAVRAQGRGSS
jgi:hypothetical protein